MKKNLSFVSEPHENNERYCGDGCIDKSGSHTVELSMAISHPFRSTSQNSQPTFGLLSDCFLKIRVAAVEKVPRKRQPKRSIVLAD
jgi:hypothetical protein